MTNAEMLESDMRAAAQTVSASRIIAHADEEAIELALKRPFEESAAALEAMLVERETAMSELREWVTNGARTLRALANIAVQKNKDEAAEATRLIDGLKGNPKLNGDVK